MVAATAIAGPSARTRRDRSARARLQTMAIAARGIPGIASSGRTNDAVVVAIASVVTATSLSFVNVAAIAPSPRIAVEKYTAKGHTVTACESDHVIVTSPAASRGAPVRLARE